MAFVPLFPELRRTSLLVCDGCNGVLTHEELTTVKPHRESDPSDQAPHYDEPSILRSEALSSGWTADGAEWKCGRCSTPPEAT